MQAERSSYSTAQNEVRNHKIKRIVLTCVGVALFLISTLICGILALVINFTDSYGFLTFNGIFYGLVLVIVYFIFGIIAPLCLIVPTFWRGTANYHVPTASPARYQAATAELQRSKNNIKYVKLTYDQACSKHEDEKMRYEFVCRQTLPYAAELYQTLASQYATILDVSDWKSIDVIIYYLDTGRADTKKEALLLLENKCHADRLVNTILSAAESISQTIIAESIAARSHMEMCMERLKNQSKDQYARLERQINSIESNVSCGIENLQNHYVNQTMLLSKIKNDCTSVAEDVRYVVEREKLYGR